MVQTIITSNHTNQLNQRSRQSKITFNHKNQLNQRFRQSSHPITQIS